MIKQFLGWCTEKAARSRLAPHLSVLLAYVVWTHAIPELRIGPLGNLPPAYAVLVILVPMVAVQALVGARRLASGGTLALWLGPALISAGALAGYLMHPGEASWTVAWRYALLPWVIPVMVLGLDHKASSLAWQGLTIGFLLLLGYGAYGFITGEVGNPLEHALGYFGIQYNVATRNGDAMYLLVLFFHLLLPVVTARAWAAGPWIALGGLTGGALILTQSRGVWLAVLVGLAVSASVLKRQALWEGQTRRKVLGVLLLAVVTAGVASYWRGTGMFLFRRSLGVLAGDPGGSLQDRITLLTTGLTLLADHPAVGIGPGTFRKRIEQAGIHLDQGVANHVEIAFLQVWLDAGLLGWVGFMALWLRLVLRSPPGLGRGGEGVRCCCVKGLASGLSVFLLFNVPFDNVAFWVVVALVAAYQIRAVNGRVKA